VVTAKLLERDGEFEYHIKHNSERAKAEMSGEARRCRPPQANRAGLHQAYETAVNISNLANGALGERPAA
jgi:hypothetical protein